MTNINTSIFTVSALLQGTSSQPQASQGGISDFDLLLSSLTPASTSNSNNSSAIDLLSCSAMCDASGGTSLDGLESLSGNSATGSLNDLFNTIMGNNSATGANEFPFSPQFESAFGSSGPLLNYIDQVTASLHLDASQNQALQQISVENQDTTGSAADVQAISQELQVAGL